MNMILEILGKGLQQDLLSLYMPRCDVLDEPSEKHLLEASAQSPADIAYKLRLAVHYALIGATDRAEELFTDILRLDPHHLDTCLVWAGMHNYTGRIEQIIDRLGYAYRYHPRDPRVLFGLGLCYERQGDVDKARELYASALEFGSRYEPPRHRLAAIERLQKNPGAALEHYEHVQRNHPEHIWYYMAVGQLCLEIRQFDRAKDAFERALTIEPDNFELHDDSIESLAQEGQYEKAIERLHEIIETQGDFPDTYVRLGDLHNQAGQPDEAFECYRKALDIQPGYLEATVKLGTQHLRMKHYLDAAKFFSQAIEINERILVCYVGLAVSHLCLKEYDAANDTFELALAIEPNSNLLYSEVARLQLKIAMQNAPDSFDTDLLEKVQTHQPEELLNQQLHRHQQSLRNHPGNAERNYRYAVLLRGLGHNAQAIDYLQRAVKINPSYSAARIKLGLALLEHQQNEQALDQFQKSFTLDDDFVKLHYKLGLMYCDKVQFALAVEHFQLNQTQPIDSLDSQANLRLALQNMNLIDRPTAIWRSVCELDPESAMAFQSQRSFSTLNFVP